jgi:hypothetical protein
MGGLPGLESTGGGYADEKHGWIDSSNLSIKLANLPFQNLVHYVRKFIKTLCARQSIPPP